ncbi:hypothetical protein EVAR_88314_1 [Eumeta japonica]|uniref:Uncharacterized protein n=1 Tax=Eumeta variegata TaxID=151549 RepID=A0A4C1VN34_EUMVA|nr:hypothetical protein EVAR_88314_1 [Eumeta japonica]
MFVRLSIRRGGVRPNVNFGDFSFPRPLSFPKGGGGRVAWQPATLARSRRRRRRRAPNHDTNTALGRRAVPLSAENSFEGLIAIKLAYRLPVQISTMSDLRLTNIVIYQKNQRQGQIHTASNGKEQAEAAQSERSGRGLATLPACQMIGGPNEPLLGEGQTEKEASADPTRYGPMT